eukprot:m.244663 g.244663  ORF g.244663 m.244663 type:complete len:173 (+) comp17467_c0_seq16:1179-1697(+)
MADWADSRWIAKVALVGAAAGVAAYVLYRQEIRPLEATQQTYQKAKRRLFNKPRTESISDGWSLVDQEEAEVVVHDESGDDFAAPDELDHPDQSALPTEAVRVPLGHQAYTSEMEVFEAVATGEDYMDDDDEDDKDDNGTSGPPGDDAMPPSNEQRQFAQSLEQALRHASSN